MKLAFSTNAYTRFPLIEALRGIKAAGFTGVEILADTPHVYPDAIDEAQTTAIRRELGRLDLRASNINARNIPFICGTPAMSTCAMHSVRPTRKF